MSDPFRDEIRVLPDQFQWEPILEGGVLPDEGRVVIAGMGGSAMAGEFAALRLQEKREFRILRDEVLPGWVTPRDVLLCMSHSGNTSEVLAVWDEAARRGLTCGAVASGGALLERAGRAGAPHCVVPAGLAPRSALGYLMRAGLSLLGEPGEQAFWDEVAGVLRRVGATWPEAPAATEDSDPESAPAAELAWRLHRRMPVLIALEPQYLPAVRRWAGSLSENAKAPAMVWEFPECNHNAIMVHADEAVESLPLVPVTLGSPRHPRRAERWGVVRELLADQGVTILEVVEPHPDPWVESLALAHVGDWVSVLLAELEGIPAGSLSLMNTLKTRLAR